MDLTLTEEQEMLGASARAFVGRASPVDPWPTMTSLGWAGLAIPEAHGGAGRGLLEVAVLCEALGRGPVVSPIVTTTAAALSILPSDGSRWLAPLAAGDAIATLAILEPGGHDEWDRPTMAGGPRVSGTKLLVPWADAADVLVVTTADGPHLVRTEQPGVTVTRHDDLDADPTFAVELDGAEAEPVAADVARGLDAAAVLQLAYVVGAADRALELVVRHAGEREQFGRPIGAFQAVAHRCVDIRTDIDACRYLAYRAAWAVDRGGDAELEVGSAKAYGNDAMRRVFANAHQVMGAVGFSTEHDLHLFTRRAKALELTYGTTARHLDRVASAMGLPS